LILYFLRDIDLKERRCDISVFQLH
jgi:hypothetical protein